MGEPDFEGWVKDWQAEHALEVDGVVGPLTWASVMGAIDGLSSRNRELVDDVARAHETVTLLSAELERCENPDMVHTGSAVELFLGGMVAGAVVVFLLVMAFA